MNDYKKTRWLNYSLDLAKPENLEQLSEFLKHSWKSSYIDLFPDSIPDKLFHKDTVRKWIVSQNIYVEIIRNCDEMIVACIIAFQNLNLVHIRKLYVHPDFQHQEFGTKLVNSLFIKFDTDKLFSLKLFANNIKAYTFYCSMGFKEVDRIDKDFFQQKVTFIIMQKNQSSPIHQN